MKSEVRKLAGNPNKKKVKDGKEGCHMRDICTRQKFLADEVISYGLSMNTGWELGRGKGASDYIVEETYNFTSMFHSNTFTIYSP